MKKFLVIFTLWIAAHTSLAMELEKSKTTNPNILAQITCVKNPRYAQFLANNHVVMADENGCSIVDTKTNTEVKKISKIGRRQIAIHPNKKLFALFYDNMIDIYDIEKNNYIWQKQVESTLTDVPQPYDKIVDIEFNPHDTNIFVISASFDDYTQANNCCIPKNYNLTECNYITNQDNHFAFVYNSRPPIVAISPTQQEICIVHPDGVTFHSIDHSTEIEFLSQTRSAESYGKAHKDFCEYSPDGSYIIQGDCYDNIYIINSQNIELYKSFPALYNRYNQHFQNALVYSNSIVATASSLPIFHPNTSNTKEVNTVLSYWDIHTKKLIHENIALDPSDTYDFSFSPDKTKVIIALKDKCVIFHVPFKVMDLEIVKNIFSYLLFLIKNYTSQCDAIEIPQDVTHLIGNLVLELYKRH